MSKYICDHPLIIFYILAFALAWSIKIPAGLSGTDNILFRLLPSFFPAVAALVTAGVMAGGRGVRDLLSQVGKLRVSPLWYLLALAGPVALNLLPLILALPFGNAFPKFDFAGIRIVLVVLVATFFALGEELGWRGFALPRLQTRFGFLAASLVVGTLWWAWHLPEALSGPGAGISPAQTIGPESQDLVFDVAVSIVMTWVYNSTGGSVFLVALFHVGTGLLGAFFALPSTPNTSIVSLLLNVLPWIAAAILLLYQMAQVPAQEPETAR